MNKIVCAPSEDSNQPGHLCTQWVAKDPSFLHAGSEDSDLSLHWAHMPFSWFCHEAAHFKCLKLSV